MVQELFAGEGEGNILTWDQNVAQPLMEARACVEAMIEERAKMLH